MPFANTANYPEKTETFGKYPTYTVAIRTLGKAGDKYLRTLKSIDRQLIEPENIFVCIPHGYALPNETIGREQYIRCDKGMIAQRALDFDEITSEYILFLDDDLEFDEYFVQNLFDQLLEMQGDCIAPDIYPMKQLSLKEKIRIYLRSGSRPHFNKDWAFIIRSDSHYSYNNNQSGAKLSQSAAGACALCKKSTYKAIHFKDERWVDNVEYALGEDQLFFYKIYKYGFRLIVSFDAKIKHLDGRSTASANDMLKKHYQTEFLRYLLWYRSIWQPQTTFISKCLCWMHFFIFRKLRKMPVHLFYILKYRTLKFFQMEKEAHRSARKFIAEKFSDIPTYMAHKKEH